MNRVRQWNAAVPIGTAVHVMDLEAAPWIGTMQSLAFIDDQNRIVAKVLNGSPIETVTIPISQLRPRVSRH
jgi:hypothetical protein